VVSRSIGVSFEMLEEADCRPVLHRADFDNAFRPEIADFEDPRDPQQPARWNTRKSAEELRRGRKNDVGPLQSRHGRRC
jgi:hypothetical protein